MSISKKTINIMNSFINDFLELITLESLKLVRFKKIRTLSSLEIKTAAKLLLPRELALHAIIFGNWAIYPKNK